MGRKKLFFISGVVVGNNSSNNTTQQNPTDLQELQQEINKLRKGVQQIGSTFSPAEKRQKAFQFLANQSQLAIKIFVNENNNTQQPKLIPENNTQTQEQVTQINLQNVSKNPNPKQIKELSIQEQTNLILRELNQKNIYKLSEKLFIIKVFNVYILIDENYTNTVLDEDMATIKITEILTELKAIADEIKRQEEIKLKIENIMKQLQSNQIIELSDYKLHKIFEGEFAVKNGDQKSLSMTEDEVCSLLHQILDESENI